MQDEMCITLIATDFDETPGAASASNFSNPFDSISNDNDDVLNFDDLDQFFKN